MIRGLTVFALLAIVWGLWSGTYSQEPLIFAFGVFSCLAVTGFVLRMDSVTDDLPGGLPGIGVLMRAPRYLVFLFIKTARANLRVARLILDPKMPMRPHLLRCEAKQRAVWAQVVHANSITLTPGTITLDLRDGMLLIHSLGPISAGSVEEDEFNEEVSRLEGSLAGQETQGATS